jgi:hypothetical protein
MLKSILPVLGVQICLMLIVSIFFVACIGAAVDSQGAILFLMSSPIIFLLFGFSLLVILALPPKRVRLRLFLRLEILAFFLAWALAIAGIKMKPLEWIPISAMEVSSGVFKSFMGISPYGWTKEKREYREKLVEELRSNTKSWNLSAFSPAELNWEQVCVLGPYRDQKNADEILGYLSAIMESSRVPHSDSYVALLFIDREKKALLVDLPRSPVDLAEFDQKCIGKEDAVFYIEVDVNGKRIAKSAILPR